MARLILQAVLRAYSQVLFGRDPRVGGLLLAATMVVPWVGLHGLVAVLIATGTAQFAGLHREAISEGLFGYNALLLGLGVGAFLPAVPATWLILVLGAAATVVGMAALRAGTSLPPLTVPFLVVFWLAWWIGPSLGAPVSVEPAGDLGLPAFAAFTLKSLGTLFFVPRIPAGLLVGMALLGWSRQGAVFAAAGLAAAGLVAVVLPLPPDASFPSILGINLALVGMALGGVWFVPSWSSLGLATMAAALTGLVAVGASPLFARLGLPILIAPFNLAVWSMLLAMRQRTRDGMPKAVDFAPGTPEQNLETVRTRMARFGASYWIRFRAPVLGTWTVTQSEGDGPTHQALWKSALDLEVAGRDGALHRGDGSKKEDYLCWRLPVLAPAAGTVAKVIDGVADNAVGQVELDDNWGNVVVLWHAPGLYSLVAHLSPGTIEVTEGQRVQRGQALGRCGSSGRSPRPHLHFQLQASVEPGAPTLPLELHDVVQRMDGHSVCRGAWQPKTGDQLTNLVPADWADDALGWVPGRSFGLAVEGEPVELTPRIELTGARVLEDPDGGRLVYGIDDDLLTIYDVQASRSSVLHCIAAALPRVPLDDETPRLEWEDHLSPRTTLPLGLGWLWDAVAPFVPWQGLTLRYRLEKDGSDRVVIGTGETVQTTARFRPGVGLLSIERTVQGKTVRATRAEGGTP